MKKISHKKRSRLIAVILGIFACTMLVKGASLQPEITKNKDKIAELEENIEYAEQRAKEVDHLKENVGSDEYIEKTASEKLGMIKKDEIVFIDVTGKDNNE